MTRRIPTTTTTATAATPTDVGLLLLRAGVGVVFLAHGLQKALAIGPANLAGLFGNLGIPLPYLNALFITGLEIVGGLALIAGLLTRVAAPLLAATMAVAIGTVHASNGFFMANDGYEFALLLLLANSALALTGAGALSADARLFGRRVEAVVEPSTSRRAA